MTVDEQKQQLRLCAEKLAEFAVLIEPLFKAGHKGFAPDCDWWCIIAGMRHCTLSDVRMLNAFADQLDGPRQEYSPEWLKVQMMKQRNRAVAESEVSSPCGNGCCLLVWKNQYEKQ